MVVWFFSTVLEKRKNARLSHDVQVSKCEVVLEYLS